MKILQLLPELHSGGVERGTLELGRYLVEQGHPSVVVSNGGRLVAQLEAEGSRHVTFPVHRKSPASLLQVRPLREFLRAEKPDILHARSRVPAWLAFLAWRRMAPATRPKFVTTVHGFNSVSPYSRIMTRGERVICVSHSIHDFVRRKYPGCPEERLAVIPRGIDPTEYPREFQPSPEWLEDWYGEFPETRGKRLLVLPGRITRLKGHHDFLRLIKDLAPHHPDVHGVVAGGAPPTKQAYLHEIERTIEEMGLGDRITLTGLRAGLREILAISSIACSLTQQPESFGRTTLESLALGTPVIGYDYGGVGEILAALLPAGAVPPGDHAALVERSARFLAAPPAIARENPFSLARMLTDTVALYEALLKA